jgi:hypothetical protein
MNASLAWLAAAAPLLAFAQAGVTPIPQKHIPPSVLMELRALESQFDLALARDCAPEKCASKGCAYVDHAVVDLPNSTSLPGLGQQAGPGSVPPQEYLTQAHCDFAHEKALPGREVQNLVRRLEQRLSKSWLQVAVGRQILEPISPSLAESPPPRPEPLPPQLQLPRPAEPPPPPQKWEAEVAARELWVALLPHFAWMIALVMGTTAALVLIWAARRVGRETAEEKALAAQIAAGALGAPKEDAAKEEEAAEEAGAAQGGNGAADLHVAQELARVEEQKRLWGDRIAQAELGKDEGGMVVELLRQWLKAGELALLAKAIFVFGDRLSLAFSSDGDLGPRKVELAEYLRSVDESKLPSDADFLRTLNHHALASALLAQPDADAYRSIREDFGSSGVADLIERLPGRAGAILFAMVPADFQHEVARVLPAETRLQVIGQLLASNRLSPEERKSLFEAVDAARAGKALPEPPKETAHSIHDRGPEFDAAGALSVLFSHVSAEERHSLMSTALQRASGALPRWYEDILHPDMLLKVPEELRADLLLEVDLKGLAGWSSVQEPQWRQHFLAGLVPSMQAAVRANMAFQSRSDQLALARRGHAELVAAMKRLVARGKISFPELVA